MHRFNRLCLVASIIMLVCPRERAAAQDWPQWLGANRDAKTTGFKAPATWPKELAQGWRVEVGEGVSTPALVGDKLYVFSRQEGREVTRCLEAATGREIWKDAYDSLGATGPASGFSGPRSSPTVSGGRVITMGVRGVLSCLEAATGNVLWRKNDFAGAWPRFFVSSSPLVADDLCVAQVGGPDNGGIVAYRLEGGAEAWRWTGDAPAYASPVLATVDGTRLVIAQTDRKMVGLQVKDGTLLWETPFAVEGRGYNAATPIVEGSTIIYAGSGRGATALRLKRQGDGCVGDAVWQNLDNSVQFNSPVLGNGQVVGLSADNQFFCLDARDGKTLWVAPLTAGAAEAAAPERAGGGRGRRGGGGGRGGYGSIVNAGSAWFALTPASELIVFEPGATALKELARYKLADSPTYAYPVLSDQRLFVKDEASLTLWKLP